MSKVPDEIVKAINHLVEWADTHGSACEMENVNLMERSEKGRDIARARLDALILAHVARPSLDDIAAMLTSEDMRTEALVAWRKVAPETGFALRLSGMNAALCAAAKAVLAMGTQK